VDVTLFEKIQLLVEKLMQPQEMQLRMLIPEIDRIIRDHVTETNAIEWVLDRLIEYAGTPAGLQQFKRLCRYFWTIDPVRTSWHVSEYRDWYKNTTENKSGE